MTGSARQHRLRPWLSVVAVVALIAGSIFLYMVLPIIGISAAAASGVVAIVAIKHLGLIALSLAPVYALFRRRSRR